MFYLLYCYSWNEAAEWLRRWAASPQHSADVDSSSARVTQCSLHFRKFFYKILKTCNITKCCHKFYKDYGIKQQSLVFHRILILQNTNVCVYKIQFLLIFVIFICISPTFDFYRTSHPNMPRTLILTTNFWMNLENRRKI